MLIWIPVSDYQSFSFFTSTEVLSWIFAALYHSSLTRIVDTFLSLYLANLCGYELLIAYQSEGNLTISYLDSSHFAETL